MDRADRRSHWDDRYSTTGADSVSWFEAEPRLSLKLLGLVGTTPASSVIDVGGGASSLTATLQRRDFADLTVLDVSAEALDAARCGVERPAEISWIRADLLDWSPPRRWNVWHDRAVFHFLTAPDDRRRYRKLLLHYLEPGGSVILATFAEDGPTTCSALPVERYSPARLLDELGPGFTENEHRRCEHVTPSGAVQPFTWVVATADSV